MGDEKNRHLGAVIHFEQGFVHDRLGQGVHGAIGFVKKQHLRIVDQGADDLGASRHTRGNLSGELFRDVADPGFGQHILCLFPGFRLAHAFLHDGPVCDVVDQGLPREQSPVLENHHPVGALFSQRLAGTAKELAVNVDFAGSDRMEPGNSIQKRRLATSRRTDDHAYLAGRDFKRAVVDREHVDPIGIIYLGDVADADRALAGDGLGTRYAVCWRRHRSS